MNNNILRIFQAGNNNSSMTIFNVSKSGLLEATPPIKNYISPQ